MSPLRVAAVIARRQVRLIADLSAPGNDGGGRKRTSGITRVPIFQSLPRGGGGRRDYDITEIDITESDVAEFDITENDITESDIAETNIT